MSIKPLQPTSGVATVGLIRSDRERRSRLSGKRYTVLIWMTHDEANLVR